MPPTSHPRGPFVGRDLELKALARLVGLGSDQLRGAGVVVGGDAGVGKTRLLSELVARAQEAGHTVLVGHCLDVGDSALPYLPFREMLDRFATAAPEVATALLEQHPAVSRLVPGRAARFDAEESLGGDGGGRTDRAGLFEGVVGGLRWLAERSPVLVVVEDLHWADASTRELLGYLFARREVGVAVVGSYRADDLHRRHPLRPALAEWLRLPGVSRELLAPLPTADVRSLVQTLVEAPVSEEQVRAIVSRAEGNPFFVEELTSATLSGEPGGLPLDLAELLLVRADRLDESTRTVVRAAAVAGRAVTHQLLAEVVELDATDLQLALRTAVEGSVLVAADTDGYAFRHALLAEAIYADLLPGERVRLHGAYARALASGALTGSAAELARHARAAGDPEMALDASVRAGDDAMAVAGWAEAAHHYEVALELAANRRTEGSAQLTAAVDIVALTEKASRAAAAGGDVQRAVALAQDQLARLPADTSAAQRARLLLTLAEAAILTDTQLDLLQLSGDALELAPTEPPSRLRARALTMHARANMDRRRNEVAGGWAKEALAMAAELGLVDLVADARTVLARLTERAGDPSASLAALEAAVLTARGAGELTAELRSQFSVGDLHYQLARWEQAGEAYRAAMECARATGHHWAPYGIDARVMASLVAYHRGEWDEADRLTDTSTESPPPLAWAVLTAAGLGPPAGRGEPKALSRLPELRRLWGSEGMIAVLAGGAAIDLYGDARDLAAALALHDEVVSTVGALWDNKQFQAQVRLSALALAQLAGASARTPLRERGALVDRGQVYRDTAVDVAAHALTTRHRLGLEIQAWQARVDAEHARLRWLAGVDAPSEDELLTSREHDVAAFERLGHVFELARSKARLAVVLRAVGRPDQAAEVAREATEVATRLRATPLLAELGASPARVARARTGESTRLLTDRELEVLGLVALGRTNREIAQQLFISTKTASVHVSHIMAKLGAGGRTEAVAVARSRSLLPGDEST